MLLSETPETPSAHPRNVIVGHAVALATGWVALTATGLLHHPAALQEGISTPRIVAAALSLALTALALQLLHTPHPPAGATTLIVSLGLLKTGGQLLVMMTAVLLCTACTFAIRELFHRRMRVVADDE